MVRVAILCREPKVSFSMDVYAQGLIRSLRVVRPQWDFIELRPQATHRSQNPWLDGAKKYYRRYWQYPRSARHADVDLFHVIDHSDGHLAYWLPKTNKPVLVTCHDLINFIQPDNIRDQAKLAFISTALWKYAVRGVRYADHVITVSQYTAENVVKFLGVSPSKLTPIPNGSSPGFIPLPNNQIQRIRQYYKVPEDTFCLLHVGSNHPRKNILTVLKVLKQLCEQGRKVCLIKAGADFSSEQTAFIQANLLAQDIIHIQKPDQASLVELYNAADVLLSPSLYEGFGITLLEAMACGTPVVTSNATALPEVVGDAGITLPPHEVNKMVGAIIKLIENQDYRYDLTKRGLEHVQAFTWENTAERVAQVYETFLTRSA